MKKFKVTMMVPQTNIIEANDMQDAHNYVSKMMLNQPSSNPGPKVLGIEELKENEIDFSDFPPPDDVA